MEQTNHNMSSRIEQDTMGKIEVPSDRYWGAQTQRSIRYFSIGNNKMPFEIVQALFLIKKVAAQTNQAVGVLSEDEAKLIIQASDDCLAGQWENSQGIMCHVKDHFPLHVWMTGSGTQCNMNVNEVIANRAIERAGGVLGSKTPIHPNDHVNRSQSSNDVFPTAMHIAIVNLLIKKLIPHLEDMQQAFQHKSLTWRKIVKVGRTHMQDAVPMTLGQAFGGYAFMLKENLEYLRQIIDKLYALTLGGTAVGTGINAPADFATVAVRSIARITKYPFRESLNRFAEQGSHDTVVMTSGCLRTLANSLYKIANDIRLLSCGPRAGFYELILPSNEPGSSIMPGKVNPTQCEAMAMAAIQVMGNDTAVGFAGASGSLEMNVYKPMMAYNVLESLHLLADCCQNFTHFVMKGIQPNRERMKYHVNRSLMLATALCPILGYDVASKIAKQAAEDGTSIRTVIIDQGLLSPTQFDQAVDPYRMTQPAISKK